MIAEKNISRIQIIVFLIVAIIVARLLSYYWKGLNLFADTKLVDIPYDIKCFFGEDGCFEGDIDGYSVFQFILFFFIGYFIPEQYLFVLAISIGYEVIKPILNMEAKIIINPLINITAYSAGSLLSCRKRVYLQEKYKKING